MSRTIRYYIDLIWVLTKKEIKIRYRNSLLGYFWSIAHPLAFAFVFFIAFKIVMRINVNDYALFLIAGLFPWQWFANSVNASAGVLLGNASLIKKINFPREMLPLTVLLNDAIHFLLSIPVILLFDFLYGVPLSGRIIYGIPVLMLLQIVFTYGVCLAISSINLFFRDLERIVGIFLTLLFYFTPIIYPESMIPERFKGFVIFNPMACLIINWRALFLNENLIETYLLASMIYGIGMFLLGYLVFKKLSVRFAEVL